MSSIQSTHVLRMTSNGSESIKLRPKASVLRSKRAVKELIPLLGHSTQEKETETTGQLEAILSLHPETTSDPPFLVPRIHRETPSKSACYQQILS